MNEQKIISVYVDPTDGSRAMQQIRGAVGEDGWRILSITYFNHVAHARRYSPGTGDPRLLNREPVLVLLEREHVETGRGLAAAILTGVN